MQKSTPCSENQRAVGLRRIEIPFRRRVTQTRRLFLFRRQREHDVFERYPQLVRIGTHGVSAGSTATLRTRLRTHFGTRRGAGNHRASVFRLHVGRALIERDGLHAAFPNWGRGQSASKKIATEETELEMRVSEYIGKLRVLFTPVSDTAGTTSLRAVIERQFIALFTEHMCALESPSSSWLGRFSDKPAIREFGSLEHSRRRRKVRFEIR